MRPLAYSRTGRGPWLGVLTLVFLCLTIALMSSAQEPAAGNQSEDLRKQIEDKNQEIRRLEAEAAEHRRAIEDLERTANTFASQIQGIDRTISRLTTSIRLTNTKISRANLEIRELTQDIQGKEESIGAERRHMASLVVALAAMDRETPLEIMMKHETISSFFNSVDQLLGVQAEIQSTLETLRTARAALQESKLKTEKKKLELSALAEDLDDQKALQLEERQERSNLLQTTKSQERRYQELLAEAERKREALEQEINALESGLSPEFDRSILPKASSGILGWPLSDPIFITQYFGNTAFARSGAYQGKGHNGIDLRASVGTPVFSSEQGRVRSTGDTDQSCRRASYGKWVLIDHPNNLATLYAHLSLVKVRPGDAVNRGELIGYSGRTGYATGPHLHLTVFASQAVTVTQMRSRTCGRLMTLPISPFGGYMNPLDYL